MLDKISGTLKTQIFLVKDPVVMEMAFDFIFLLIFFAAAIRILHFPPKSKGFSNRFRSFEIAEDFLDSQKIFIEIPNYLLTFDNIRDTIAPEGGVFHARL